MLGPWTVVATGSFFQLISCHNVFMRETRCVIFPMSIHNLCFFFQNDDHVGIFLGVCMVLVDGYIII